MSEKSAGKINYLICFFAFLSLSILYSYVGYFSFGFDDEFWNITIVEKYGKDIVKFSQNEDIHPPLSYILNLVFFKFFDSWNIVRLISGLLTSLSIIYLIIHITNIYGRLSGFFAFFLIGLNPGILMWCTSLRWYSYFIPILNFILVTPKKLNGWLYWQKLLVGLVLMAYLNYVTLLIAPILIYYYWMKCNDELKIRTRHLLTLLITLIITTSYQAYFFLTIHLPNSETQFSPLINNLAGVVISNFSNQGVFPLSIAGIVSISGTLLIILIIIKYVLLGKKREYLFEIYLILTAIFIFVGLAGKFRNNLLISPVQALMFCSFIPIIRKKHFLILLSMIVIGNLAGVLNVVKHENTIKNNWNFPIQDVLNKIDILNSQSKANLILTHDPLLTNILENKKLKLLSPYSSNSVKIVNDISKIENLIIIKTYKGSINVDKIRKMYDEVEKVEFDGKDSFRFGLDKFYNYKRIIDPYFPQYQVEIVYLKNIIYCPNFLEWIDNT